MTPLIISESFRTLLGELENECKCAKLLLKSLCKPRYLSPEAPGNYIAFRETSGMISYCPSGKEQAMTDEGKWTRKGRQDMKPAKWAQKTLNPRLVRRLKPEIIGRFSELFAKAENRHAITIEYSTFEVAYDSNLYREGHLPSSCMWCDPVGDFYRHVGAKVIVARDGEGKLRGRAIVWPEVEINGETVQVMDRVYAGSPDVAHHFFQWAKDNDVWRKTFQSNDSLCDFVKPDGMKVSRDGKIEFRRSLPSCGMFYPYLDTFRYGDDNSLTNCDGVLEYTYDGTSGVREGGEDEHEGEVQDVDGEWIDEDDAVSVDGDYYPSNDDRICFCERSQEHILRSDAYEVEVSRGTTYILHERFVTQLD